MFLRVCVCVLASEDKTRHQMKRHEEDETFADTSGFAGSSQDKGACYWQSELIQVHVDTS